MELDLTISGLSVVSDRGRRLLWIPDLTVKSGTLLGIRGASGAGKSTFIFAIAGLDDTATGTVRWGDTDLLALAPDARAAFRRDHLGLVFQDAMLFEELSALENASLSSMFSPPERRSELYRRALSMLMRLGLPSAPKSGLFAGGPPVSELSVGERQRISVARAQSSGAPVLLADEPTANLDRAAAIKLSEDMTDRCRRGGKTLICASHDLDILSRMDRLMTLRDGLILEET